MSNAKTLTPMRAIRAYCVDCSGGNRPEVRLCHINDCPLHRYRMGRNPARRRKDDSKPVLTDLSAKPCVESGFPAPESISREGCNDA